MSLHAFVVYQHADEGIGYHLRRNDLDWAERRGFAEIEFDYAQTLEKGHGRIEARRCWVTEEIAWLEQKAEWANLKSVIMVESEREIIGGEKTVERRYFISSLAANAREALRAVRGHWAIENELHWCLDIGFREDECRSRTGNDAKRTLLSILLWNMHPPHRTPAIPLIAYQSYDPVYFVR